MTRLSVRSLSLCFAVLAACGSGRDLGGGFSASSDPLTLRELTGEESAALLDFVNGADADALGAVPGLSSTAIHGSFGILAARPFATPEDLLDVPGIGATTLMVLVAYTSDRGNNHPVCPEAGSPSLCFSKATAIAMVHFANRATFEQLADSDGVSLSDSISAAVIAARPYASLDRLAGIPGIGPFALLKIEAMVYQLAHAE